LKITTTPIDGLLVIEPQIFKDSRGYFFESYNQDKMKEAGIVLSFVQDNQWQPLSYLMQSYSTLFSSI
jgi:dTDP-4-dehydrorhamnose 3,5-epimerase